MAKQAPHFKQGFAGPWFAGQADQLHIGFYVQAPQHATEQISTDKAVLRLLLAFLEVSAVIALAQKHV